jgi:enoyl-CoA hydratase
VPSYETLAYETLAYATDGAIATITLNRPDDLNTIVPPMTDELEGAVHEAIRDGDVKVIVLRGAGRAFCAGFNFSGGFHQWDDDLATGGRWDPGKEFIMTSSPVTGWVPKFMSLWHSPKPVIAMVHGWCVGGGSEMALCADIVLMSEDSRMWGCHHAGMWVYRLGLAKAKELALTGRPLSGVEAAQVGLVNAAHPFEELETRAYELARQLCSIPLSQLTAMKLVVNQAYENMGLKTTQLYGSTLDGMLRNTPEALEFIDFAEREGVPAAVARRDSPFNDYSAGPREGKPDPTNTYPPPPRPGVSRK